MPEQITVVVRDENAQVVQYSTSEQGRRDEIAVASKQDSTKFNFSEGQSTFLARLQANQLRKT